MNREADLQRLQSHLAWLAGNVIDRHGWGAPELVQALSDRGLEALGGEQREHAGIQFLLEHTWALAAAGCPASSDVWTLLAMGATAPVPWTVLAFAARLSPADLSRALDVLQHHGIARLEPIVGHDDGRPMAHWSLDHPILREFVMHKASPHQPRIAALHPAWRDAWFAFLQVCQGALKVPCGYQRYEHLVPHFDALLEGIALREPGDASSNVKALGYVAMMHRRHGRCTLAEEYDRKHLTWCEKHLGPEHLDTINSRGHLAMVQRSRGEFDAEEPLCWRAPEVRAHTLGPEQPDVIDSLTDLADLLSAHGDLAGAELLYRRALEDRERTLGPEHPVTLQSLNNLANSLNAQGDLARAEPLYRRALEARERILGPEHLDTLTSLNNLTVLLKAKGDLAGAEPLAQRAWEPYCRLHLEAWERTLGPDYLHTLWTLDGLGSLRQIQGRVEEAEALFAQSVAGAQEMFLPQHPIRLKYEQNLARVRDALRNQQGE